MKKRGRRGFDEQFRREAVRLAEAGTMPLAEVARQLGVHLETLRNWRRQARAAGDAEAATVPSLEEENRRLRRENARLLEEREILKNATADSTGECNSGLLCMYSSEVVNGADRTSWTVGNQEGGALGAVQSR